MKHSGDVVRKNVIEMNEHQKEMRELITANEKQEFFYKVDDPVYYEFRTNIKDKKEWNNKIKSIQLSAEKTIWRTDKDYEKICKEMLTK
jgi:hypothetical protein